MINFCSFWKASNIGQNFAACSAVSVSPLAITSAAAACMSVRNCSITCSVVGGVAFSLAGSAADQTGAIHSRPSSVTMLFVFIVVSLAIVLMPWESYATFVEATTCPFVLYPLPEGAGCCLGDLAALPYFRPRYSTARLSPPRVGSGVLRPALRLLNDLLEKIRPHVAGDASRKLTEDRKDLGFLTAAKPNRPQEDTQATVGAKPESLGGQSCRCIVGQQHRIRVVVHQAQGCLLSCIQSEGFHERSETGSEE